tara:strand:- start:87 stop:659 length:573 start_codon:yes stop_codon:yes gene_type:complete
MLDVAYDYLHLPHKHKSSFNDFKVIEEKDNILVFYYETRLLNFLPYFLPFSPTIKFISIRELIPEKQMYNQVYMNLKNKKIYYHSWRQYSEDDEIIVKSDFSIPLNKIEYFFKKFLLFLINKKLHRMWQEDLEMIIQRKNDPIEEENNKCLPFNFILKKYLTKNLKTQIPENFNPDFILNKNNDNKITKY